MSPEPKRAILYLPMTGAGAWPLRRASAEHCDRRGLALKYVTGSAETVRSMVERELVDVVVVARAADRDRLLPAVEIIE